MSKMSNSQPRTQRRVRCIHVDAPGATSPLTLLVAPSIGLKHFCSCIFAHFERLEDFDVWNSSPSLFADLDQLGLSMPTLAVHLVDFKLARLPDREVKDVPERRVRGLLHKLNVVIIIHHSLQLFNHAVAEEAPLSINFVIWRVLEYQTSKMRELQKMALGYQLESDEAQILGKVQ